jgi:hypothetical protein
VDPRRNARSPEKAGVGGSIPSLAHHIQAVKSLPESVVTLEQQGFRRYIDLSSRTLATFLKYGTCNRQVDGACYPDILGSIRNLTPLGFSET